MGAELGGLTPEADGGRTDNEILEALRGGRQRCGLGSINSRGSEW